MASYSSERAARLLIGEARAKQPEALGRLLETYRDYLRILAVCHIDRRLKGRVSPSDVVQEAMLGAYRDFPDFRGRTERELLAWLRRILLNRLHVYVQQHLLAECRDVRREVSLEALVHAPAAEARHAGLADRRGTPSAIAIRRESAERLAGMLARLSPEHREVIRLRNLLGLSFDVVAERMNRSSGAARMLWLRALRELRQQAPEGSSAR